MKKTIIYTKLRLLSGYRIFNELPLLVRLLAVGLFFVFGYALVLSDLTFTISHYLYCLGIYVLVGKWICGGNPKEMMLVKTLEIPTIPILIMKGIVLSIPFFLLNALIGVLLLPLGLLLLYLFSRIRYRKRFIVPSFFCSTSYQWISAWRAEGIWIYLGGIVLLIAGLRYMNGNLVRFAILWIICLPCFLAYYKRLDPKSFLSVYKTLPLLIWRKSGELLMNSLLSSLAPVVLILIFDKSNSFPLLWMIGGMTGNFLLLYANYIAYPSQLRALCILCVLFIFYIIIYIEAYPWGPIIGLSLLPILGFFSYLNLKTSLYVQPISEN